MRFPLLQKKKRRDGSLVSAGSAVAQIWGFPVFFQTTFPGCSSPAVFSVCCPTALGSLWGFLNAVVKPGTVPHDPGWLKPSWFPSGFCWCLAMIWGPWAVTPAGSGEGNRWSSSDWQRSETKEHGWWHSWERGDFAELWPQQHFSSGGETWWKCHVVPQT